MTDCLDVKARTLSTWNLFCKNSCFHTNHATFVIICAVHVSLEIAHAIDKGNSLAVWLACTCSRTSIGCGRIPSLQQVTTQVLALQLVIEAFNIGAQAALQTTDDTIFGICAGEIPLQITCSVVECEARTTTQLLAERATVVDCSSISPCQQGPTDVMTDCLDVKARALGTWNLVWKNSCFHTHHTTFVIICAAHVSLEIAHAIDK